jgi:hypothetical protein
MHFFNHFAYAQHRYTLNLIEANMKNIIKLLLMSGLFCNLSFSQINWELDYESANFAFLKVDFITYDFEGGYFTKFDYQPGYDLAGIPFTIIFNPPIDTGDIFFSYSATNDTILFASIWWAGQGQILFPDSIIEASLFAFDSTLVVKPFTIEYYNYIGEIEDSVFQQKGDSAWLSVKKLLILDSFDELGSVFRAGLYLYAPSVGVFNPEVAKWIIFLYRGQLIAGAEDENRTPVGYKLYQNYPNPFNPKTNIEFDIAKSQNVKISIYDILGVEKAILLDGYLNAGKHKVLFDGLNYSSGVYLYKIVTDNYFKTKKLLLLK